MNWMAAIEFFGEILALSSQVAENQGMKIPMKESEIRQRSENKAGELKEKGQEDDKLPMLRFFKEQMRWIKYKHAENQMQRLIDGGSIITNIQIEKHVGKNWLYIYYIDPFEQCSTWYRVEAKN